MTDSRTPSLKKTPLFLAILSASWMVSLNAQAAPFALQADPATFASKDSRAIQSFLKQVDALLPPSLKSHLGRTITIRFQKLDDSSKITGPSCIGDSVDPDAEKQTLGYVRKSPWTSASTLAEVVLNQNFLSIIASGEASAVRYACGHKNAYRLALATAIHEVGHLYDYTDLKTSSEQAFLDRCAAAESTVSRSPGKAIDPECRKLKNRLRVSNRADFLDLMGWVETGLIFHTRGQGNQLSLRSPDPYEFKNWKEAFGVNLEFFALDPEFACRRPAVHAFYSKHFGFDPYQKTRSCKPQTTIPVNTQGTGLAPLIDIDPERVYEIHALFAGKGPEAMSKWGHSLYRIVVCSPDRKTVGPECLNDLAHHVTISFRATVPDLAISYWKGLIGKYSSTLIAQPFLATIEEYNKTEFRELVSLPLRLTEDEKRLFIFRTLEASWEYAGRYKFLTNNCATEALNFLKGVLGESRLSSRHPISPLGLHETLQKLRIVDTSVLQDHEKAVQNGYYFASKKPEVDQMLSSLIRSCQMAGCSTAMPSETDRYLSETTAEQRREWFEELAQKSSEPRHVLAARFFLLEAYSLRRSDGTLQKKLAALIEAKKIDELPPESRNSFTEIAQALDELRALILKMVPTAIQSEGYGIPIRATSDDSNSTPTDVTVPKESVERQQELMKRIVEWAKSAFKTRFNEIQESQKNKLLFLKEMRKRP
ncbi:MAG: hypothetical protein RJB38_1914 [Pseudomonadota bacterium]